MITPYDLSLIRHGTIFQHATLKDYRGEPVRCRCTGKVQTWKTRPGDFKIPVKHGLRNSFYLTPFNADDWSLT